MLINSFIYFYIFLIIFLGFKIATYENSIYGLIYLIFLFVFCFLLLINWHVEFIGLILLIIYVGAIMVFFLFILMLLNLKGLSLKKSFLNDKFLLLFLNFLLFFLFYFIIFSSLYDYNKLKILNVYIDLFRSLNLDSQLELFGFIIFVYYFIFLIILGFILLGSMIGPIVLTLRKIENIKKQKVFIQNLRDRRNSIVYIR